MIITLEQAKRYLRVDSDYIEEDELIESFILTATEILKNQTGLTEEELNKTKLSATYVYKYVAELFENRGTTEAVSLKTQFVLENIVAQLSMNSDYKEKPII